ncbi:MAG: DoxX family protein [Gracilimonas sp.]|uniref:DoxX family protein n=1 Tax=Gracilimonas sp. TaxID=1974203 RepID=UPI0019B9AF8E|nr:DoxX family protein [Gracilimonas sp.]MBD3615681.1 DoxX family protein [Gracilimonas sp.]
MNKTINHPALKWMREHRHEAIEILRICLGILLFYKGFYFVENISEVYAMIEGNIPISSFVVAHYVVGAHLAGGLMLAFGLITRLATAVQIPILAGAVFFVHARDIFLGKAAQLEYSILVLILLIVFFIYGGGKWSLDGYIIRRKQNRNK